MIKKRPFIILLAALSGVIFVIIAVYLLLFPNAPTYSIPQDIPKPLSNTELLSLPHGKVMEVVDGDTIKVAINDSTLIIRYICLDTPEIEHSATGRNQYYGQNAKEFNTWLVLNKTVFIKTDKEEKDAYGRILAYVFREDGTMANLAMIREGYARVLVIKPNNYYESLCQKTEAMAVSEKIGIWAR